MEREYEWDEEKNKSNFKKHKVWFDDRFHREAIDRREDHEGEERLIAFGKSTQGKALFVVFCERTRTKKKELIRIISARKQTSKEKKVFERHFDV